MKAKVTNIETRNIPVIGICEYCGNKTNLKRTYIHYEDIKCECHSPSHFDLIEHCDECEPKIPEKTTAILKKPKEITMNVINLESSSVQISIEKYRN